MINWVEWALLQFEEEWNELEVPVGEHSPVRYSGVRADLSEKSALEILESDELADFGLVDIGLADGADAMDGELEREVKNLVSDGGGYGRGLDRLKSDGASTSGVELAASSLGEWESKRPALDLQGLAERYESVSGGAAVDWTASTGEVTVTQHDHHRFQSDKVDVSTVQTFGGDRVDVSVAQGLNAEVLDSEPRGDSWIEAMGKARQAVEQLQTPKQSVEMDTLGAMDLSGTSGFDPWQFDKVVQRDARRYDSGFSLY